MTCPSSLPVDGRDALLTIDIGDILPPKARLISGARQTDWTRICRLVSLHWTTRAYQLAISELKALYDCQSRQPRVLLVLPNDLVD